MAAEINLNRRSKPPQIKSCRSGVQKSSLRKIHLVCDLLHPNLRRWLRQYANPSGITAEGLIGECINDVNEHGHAVEWDWESELLAKWPLCQNRTRGQRPRQSNNLQKNVQFGRYLFF
jgi:hypothetical protein